jgi:hypothetical protein
MAEVWWRHYGRGALRILCFWTTPQPGHPRCLVGVLPMFVDDIRIGPVRIRTASLVGSLSTITVTSPPVEPDYAESVYGIAAKHMFNVEHCDAVHFGPVQGDGDAAEHLRGICGAPAPGWTASERASGVCTRFDLPDSFEAYLASLGKMERSNLRRNMNKLARMPGHRARVITEPDEAQSAFEEFARMHTEQWRAEGRSGHFGDWPGSLDFARELVRTLSPMGRVAFVSLEVHGETACSYWCLLFGDRCYWRLPARRVGDRWDQLALGRVGLVTMLREMIDRGICCVDGGPGHYDYKLSHGGTEHRLTSFLFVRESRGSRLKTRAFRSFADALHYVYYRAWRLKVAPAIGVRSGPLNQWWIRTRF